MGYSSCLKWSPRGEEKRDSESIGVNEALGTISIVYIVKVESDGIRVHVL